MVTIHLTGNVAKKRIVPLLEARGIPLEEVTVNDSKVDFMWENTQSKSRRALRQTATVYSHLAQGHIFEDKWGLALLQQKVPPNVCPLLESHCLRGRQAVATWCSTRWGATVENESNLKPTENDLWVLKDAESNGAGGIWILSKHNWELLCIKEGDPLHEEHRYVAQKYVNDLALWRGRKFHIRTYVIISGDLGVYIHRKAFLHIANKPFVRSGGTEGDGEVHITNCCANSDNLTSFAGEIVIDDISLDIPYPGTGNEKTDWTKRNLTEESIQTEFDLNGNQEIGDLSFATGLQDMKKILSCLVDAAAPFLEAQTSQSHFEYMGVDFMIDENGRAWLLECNCPPSQDTATGLKHAEDLHDAVMTDIIGTFVLPNLMSSPSSTITTTTSSLSSPTNQEKVVQTNDKISPPILSNKDEPASTEHLLPRVPGQGGGERGASENDENNDDVLIHKTSTIVRNRYRSLGGWMEAREPSLIPFAPASKTTGNNLRWKLYENKCMRKSTTMLVENVTKEILKT